LKFSWVHIFLGHPCTTNTFSKCHFHSLEKNHLMPDRRNPPNSIQFTFHKRVTTNLASQFRYSFLLLVLHTLAYYLQKKILF